MKRLLNPKFIVSRLLFYLRIPLPLRVAYSAGVHVLLDPLSVPHALWLHPGKKKHDIDVIRHITNPGDICVDVGANVGHLALVMAAESKQGKVLALEPGRRMFRSLERNIRSNNMDICPVQVAVSEHEGELSFFEYSHSDTFSSMVHAKNADVVSYRVPTKRLSTLMEEYALPRIDVLKIDVEGAELHVLRSLGQRIKDVRTIYFEFNEENYSHFGYSGSEVAKLLTDAGYTLYVPQLNEGKIVLEKPERLTDNNYIAVRT